jgi:hypothetical protein
VRTIFDALARTVSRRPGLVLVAVLLVSGLFGFFNGQAVSDDGVAVENELTAAQDTLAEEFGDRQSVLQVVVEATDGSDVRSADALATTLAIQEAIADSDLAATLIDEGQQPPIASFLGGAELAVAMGGLDPRPSDDEQVRALQEQALAELPPQVAALFDGPAR